MSTQPPNLKIAEPPKKPDARTLEGRAEMLKNLQAEATRLRQSLAQVDIMQTQLARTEGAIAVLRLIDAPLEEPPS